MGVMMDFFIDLAKMISIILVIAIIVRLFSTLKVTKKSFLHVFFSLPIALCFWALIIAIMVQFYRAIIGFIVG